ncbi:MAG: transcriptional regulator, LysR family [Osedax symbiont Rs2]|nr:MAG: transcriptional regulator, LysR family [Osedax symbiont Rs2]
MDRFHSMQVFVAVAEERGFAAAARRLQLSPPAVTRAIAALELRLGISLFVRSTRHVRTTDAGLRYLEDVRIILAQAEAADDAATGIYAKPSGRLTVTASALFGKLYVMPAIIEYLQRYTDTQIEAIFLDRKVNLLEEGLDVAVRIGELADSSERALRVGSVRTITCASPAYLEQHGTAKTPDELLTHSLISSGSANQVLVWRFAENAKHRNLRIQARLTVTSNDAILDAAKQGFGIARLLSYQVAEALANNELVLLLEDYELAPLPIHVIHREGLNASAKVRTFVDLVAEKLRADQSLNYR